MNSSNIGTVNAVSPNAGLKIIPLRIRPLRSGATAETALPSRRAMSPERGRTDC
jgi:hypothetical protein